MPEPSGVRTRSQRQREPGEEQADPEMATSAAEQFEGERQPSAGGNDETRDEPQSQPQAPGAEAPTASEEDKMQPLTQLLMSMNQVLNQQAQTQAQQDRALDQKLDQQAQKQTQQAQALDQKLDQQAQVLDQKLDQQTQKSDQQAKALDMKLDQQFSRLDQDISQLSQQTGREVSRLDEEISTLNQRTEDLCREVAALRRPSATDQRHQLSVGAEPFVPAPQGRTEPAAQDRQLSLPRHHQKIPRFDGKAPWEAYLAQFHIMANANGWGDSEKAYYLSTSIEGPALSMLANLSAEDRMDFPKLVAVLDNHFGAKHQQQQSRVLLNTIKRQKSEPLQELVENIERHVRLAYPEAIGDVQEALTMHHLTSAVDERMQAELLRRKPRRLQDALEVLTTEEAIRDCNRYQYTAPVREVKAGEEAAQQQHTTSNDAFNAAVMRLTEAIQSQQVKPRADQADSPRQTSFTGYCWYCQKKGHMKRDCRKLKFEKEREAKNTQEN